MRFKIVLTVTLLTWLGTLASACALNEVAGWPAWLCALLSVVSTLGLPYVAVGVDMWLDDRRRN